MLGFGGVRDALPQNLSKNGVDDFASGSRVMLLPTRWRGPYCVDSYACFRERNATQFREALNYTNPLMMGTNTKRFRRDADSKELRHDLQCDR